MKTGLLTFEQFHGKKGMGSSRIRGHWIVNHWQDAGVDLGPCELFKHGGTYDAVIYQKAYFVEHAQAFKGLKIFDICDPDWLHWSYRVKEMIEACDLVTVSSIKLGQFIEGMTDKPVAVVPDRIDLELLPARKQHLTPAKRVVWYGYSENFPILESAVPILAKLGLELIVVSNDVFYTPTHVKIELTNLPWSDHYLADLQRGDIVINPQFSKGKWQYKSDNKTTLAWALGLPVAHDAVELKRLVAMTAEELDAEAQMLYEKAKREFDVKLSVCDYKDLLNEITKAKTQNV